jgi:hypothetical protein
MSAPEFFSTPLSQRIVSSPDGLCVFFDRGVDQRLDARWPYLLSHLRRLNAALSQ